MTSNPLVGTWRLISWETRSVDAQKISYPFGRDAVGYIMYNQQGYMFVAITRPNRERFAAGDLLSGSTEEKAHAASTYVSYCGQYEFQGGTVVLMWTSAYSPTGSALIRSVWSNLGETD
jgi:hypothetical protein